MVGVDEVGYGSWAGPLYICALEFTSAPDFELKDSKKLSEKKRLACFEKIKECAVWNIGIVSAELISEKGLAFAYKVAMMEAVEPFVKAGKKLVLDGRKPKWLECEAIVGADNIVSEVSAASIVAKCERDAFMKEQHLKYPCYNWLKNKGYGTKEHVAAIRAFGPCVMHRFNIKFFIENGLV